MVSPPGFCSSPGITRDCFAQINNLSQTTGRQQSILYKELHKPFHAHFKRSHLTFLKVEFSTYLFLLLLEHKRFNASSRIRCSFSPETDVMLFLLFQKHICFYLLAFIFMMGPLYGGPLQLYSKTAYSRYSFTIEGHRRPNSYKKTRQE